MKKIHFLLFGCLCLLGSFVSCKNVTGQTELAKQTFIVGDILLKDGRKVSYNSITDSQKKDAIAVVCCIKNDTVLGLGLKQSEEKLAWALEDTFGYDNSFEKIAYRVDTVGYDGLEHGDADGSDNWEEICKVDKDANTNSEARYPAFNWVNKYGSNYSLPKSFQNGWYLPSIAELAEIYKNMAVLNKSLVKLTSKYALPIGQEEYWSSSQAFTSEDFAYYLDVTSGVLEDLYKSDPHTVRCIRIIK